MPADPSMLCVLEGQSPSASVRGLQYRDLFARHWNAKVEFIARQPRWPNRVRQVSNSVLRLATIAGKVPIDAAHAWHLQRRTEEIARKALEFDLAYLLKIPSIELHRTLVRAGNPRVVMDVNDGLWLPFNRKAGWEHLEEMLATSAAVICENEYVASYVRRHNSNVHLVPDPAQIEAFDARRRPRQRTDGRIVLGWVGSPMTVDSLFGIYEPLERVFARHPQLHLRILGSTLDRIPRFENVRFSAVHLYDQDTMIDEVLDMDIGLFPLFHVEDSLTRGTLKASIYMAGEALVIAEDWGENPKLVENNVNGLLAAGREQWEQQLELAVTQVEKRRAMAARGLALVRERYSLDRCFQTLTGALRSAAGQAPARNEVTAS